MKTHLPVMFLIAAIVVTVTGIESSEPTINNLKFNVYFYMVTALGFALISGAYSRMIDRNREMNNAK